MFLRGKDFINFFNPVRDIENIGVYRPLTLRAFYFLGVALFNLNPMALRTVAILTFCADILLVGFLAKLLTGNVKIAALSLSLCYKRNPFRTALLYWGIPGTLFNINISTLSYIFYQI